jgi:hypothetical protein
METVEAKKPKTITEKYAAPTPIKWRKIGDSILIGSSGFSALMMGAPLHDNQIIWIVFILNGIGVCGKVITNFFTAD